METAKGAPTPTDVLRRNLRATRELRRLTVRALSQRLADLGRPMSPSGITKMENGVHGVDVGQLVALAVALNTSPSFLLTPAEHETVQIVPARSATGARVGDWVRGEGPLDGDREEFVAAAPGVVRAQYRVVQHPAVLGIKQLLMLVYAAIHGTSREDPAALAKAMRREAARVANYVELLADEAGRVTVNEAPPWTVTATDRAGATDSATFELNPGPTDGGDGGRA